MAKSSGPQVHLGILVLRVGIGLMFVAHGWPKLAGGAERWAAIGAKAMGTIGIDFAPTFFGFMAATAECFGGACIAAGLLFRPALALALATMVMAATMHLSQGDGLLGASHPIELGIVFASLFLMGPGKYVIPLRGGTSAS